MKVLLISAALVSLAMTAPASAQDAPAGPVPASTCGEIAAAPTLPDGAEAGRSQMERGNDHFQEWARAATVVVTCRQAEVRSLEAQTQARVAEYNAMVESVNAVNTAWQAEAEEFNQRTNNLPRRERP